MRTPPADLQNLVEESDQRSRITNRRLELLEERLNAAPAKKEGPILTVDDYSFQIKEQTARTASASSCSCRRISGGS